VTRSNILVVFYSRSGTTRNVASVLARLLNADLEEIFDRQGRAGPFGYLRSFVEALEQRPADIVLPKCDASAYDLVVIGTPVWAGSVSSPVRAWLVANRARLKRVAFFCSFGRRGEQLALAQMHALAGKSPLAECKITTREARHGEASQVLCDFAARLERKLSDVRRSEMER